MNGFELIRAVVAAVVAARAIWRERRRKRDRVRGLRKKIAFNRKLLATLKAQPEPELWTKQIQQTTQLIARCEEALSTEEHAHGTDE